jgi:ATP-dependent exoDNAse (exonuclease V) beta subunit
MRSAAAASLTRSSSASATNLNAGSKANWGERKAPLKALQEEYRDAHDAAQHRLRTDDLLSLLPRIERFDADYDRQRRTGGEADFDDLLFWAAELLRTSKRRAATSAAATRWW